MFSSESVPGLLLRGRRRTWAHVCLFPIELRESWNKSWSLWPGTLLPSSALTDTSWSGPWLGWHNHDISDLPALSFWLILPHSLFLRGIWSLLLCAFSYQWCAGMCSSKEVLLYFLFSHVLSHPLLELQLCFRAASVPLWHSRTCISWAHGNAVCLRPIGTMAHLLWDIGTIECFLAPIWSLGAL